MIKILFVCHGNICRSPMAQSVLTHLVRENGMQDQFFVDSMATSTEELGNPPHRGTVRKLQQMGIPVVAHRATQITRKDYDRFDYIIAMDDWNLRNLQRILQDDPEHKVHKLLSFAGSAKDIADPWYTGDFDETYSDILAGCQGLLAHLQAGSAASKEA